VGDSALLERAAGVLGLDVAAPTPAVDAGLSRSRAGRARARGGLAAAAGFLTRAAELPPVSTVRTRRAAGANLHSGRVDAGGHEPSRPGLVVPAGSRAAAAQVKPLEGAPHAGLLIWTVVPLEADDDLVGAEVALLPQVQDLADHLDVCGVGMVLGCYDWARSPSTPSARQWPYRS
jgi:hypothetical protein